MSGGVFQAISTLACWRTGFYACCCLCRAGWCRSRRRQGGGGGRVPARRHLGRCRPGRVFSHGLAAAFKRGWADAATQVELLLVNWDGDLLGV